MPRVYAIADEDLDRENDEKTSAVHFVRFELPPRARDAVRAGAGVKLGCDHTQLPGARDDRAGDAGVAWPATCADLIVLRRLHRVQRPSGGLRRRPLGGARVWRLVSERGHSVGQ